jgi:hypothetical protein
MRTAILIAAVLLSACESTREIVAVTYLECDLAKSAIAQSGMPVQGPCWVQRALAEPVAQTE